jgi:general stress protein YciG
MLCVEGNDRNHALVAIDEVEAALRARIQALAHKGGAATKLRHGSDPGYYSGIGRRGGHASVAARKAKITAELDAVKPCDASIVEAALALAEAPPVRERQRVTYKDIKAEIERERRRVADTGRRQSLADLMAERNLDLWLAQIRDEGSDYDEPWDPWTERR